MLKFISLAALFAVEAKHSGHKLQAHSQSDPISGSLGFPVRKAKKEEPIVYYPDPDTMELDGDIKDSHAHLK